MAKPKGGGRDSDQRRVAVEDGPQRPEIMPEEIRRAEGQSRSGASVDDRAAAERIGDDRAEAREIDARAGIDRRLWSITQKDERVASAAASVPSWT